MCEVIIGLVVIMEEHSAIHVLWKEVKANIVDMGRHKFIEWQLFVSPVTGHREREVTCFKDSHLTFEIFIFTRVIVLVPIANANPRCEH